MINLPVIYRFFELIYRFMFNNQIVFRYNSLKYKVVIILAQIPRNRVDSTDQFTGWRHIINGTADNSCFLQVAGLLTAADCAGAGS